MNDGLLVQVFNGQADLVAKVPEVFLREILALLALIFEQLIQIALFCELHDDVQLLIFHETGEILDYVRVSESLENLHFFERSHLVLLLHVFHIDLFEYVLAFIAMGLYSVHSSVRTFTELTNYCKI